MSAFTFIEKQCEGYFEYHLMGSREGFISDTFYNSCINEVKDDQFFEWLYEKGITNSGTMENTLLYTILLHQLMGDQSALITYFDEIDEIKQVQEDAIPKKIEWRYSIEYTRDLDVCKDFKFLNPVEFLNAVNYSNKDLSERYFYLSEIEKSNLGRYIRLFHSDVTNWNFVFCTETQVKDICEIVNNKDTRPALSNFLENGVLMLNLQIGADEGYLDYVLLQSKKSLKDKLNRIEMRINQFIKDYEILLIGFLKVEHNFRENWFKQQYELIFDKAIY